MNHEMWWDEAHQCVRFEVVGELLPHEVPSAVDEILKIFAGKAKRQLLVDHTRSTGTTSRETRAALEQRGVELALTKHAFCGMAPLNRMIARVIIGILGHSERTKFFKTREEALAWLGADR